jgi:hypothetical protein
LFVFQCAAAAIKPKVAAASGRKEIRPIMLNLLSFDIFISHYHLSLCIGIGCPSRSYFYDFG